MSQALSRNAPFLRLLHKASPKARKELLEKHCTPDLVESICECCYNVLKGSVPLTRSQKDALRRKKQMLRQLALKKTSLKKKKELIQKGGFLGVLLGPIVSVLSKVLGFGGNG